MTVIYHLQALTFDYLTLRKRNVFLYQEQTFIIGEDNFETHSVDKKAEVNAIPDYFECVLQMMHIESTRS